MRVRKLELDEALDDSVSYRNGVPIQFVPKLVDGTSRRFMDWLSRINKFSNATGEPIKRSFK